MKVPSLLVLAIAASAIVSSAIVSSLAGASSMPSEFSAAMSGFDCSLFHRTPASQSDTNPLDAVLKKMDAAAASFRAVQADFEWDRYERVIDEVDDFQTGTAYYRRNGKDKDIDMKIDDKTEGDTLKTLKPDPKFVLLTGGKITVYMARQNQVCDKDLGKNAADFQTYLALGFGSSGQDLGKAFDVTYVGPETINGIATAQLRLVPKSERVRNNFKEILLWIDLDRGISVQQKFTQPQGDWRLIKYSAIRMKDKLNDDIFKLKAPGNAQPLPGCS